MSHPSVDTPSPGTCIRIQPLGGPLHSPLPDEPPDTSVERGLTPDQARPLEGRRLAAAAMVGAVGVDPAALASEAVPPL